MDHKEKKIGYAYMAHGVIVRPATKLIIGIGASRWQEVPPLGYVFLSLLPPDLYLLIFTSSPQLIGLESFVFIS